MAASQHDVVRENREAILQALVAFSRSTQDYPGAHPASPLVRDIAYTLGRIAMQTAIRLNAKWGNHESADLIEV